MDSPKTLSSVAERSTRADLLSRPHANPLTLFVAAMRVEKGPDYQIPDFDPLDGGVEAQVLFLLEAPGRKAIATGFVSRNNPDETAKNFFLLNAEAGIDRRLTAIWNAVPWYIGSGTKIRPAKNQDVREAEMWLVQLLSILPRVRFVVFVGRKALHARSVVQTFRSNIEIMEMPHPSPMFINRDSGNRGQVLAVLQQLAVHLARNDAPMLV